MALVRGAVLAACVLAGGEGCGEPAPKTPFTVWVFDEPLDVGDADRPLADVTVMFDPRDGGERVFAMTAADGHATFEVDFAGGGVAVSVLSLDHALVTTLEASPETARARPNTFGKPQSDLVIVPPRLARATVAATAELRGALTGKSGPTSSVDLSVQGVRRLGSVETNGSSYVVRAPRGRPSFMLGHVSKPVVDDGVSRTFDPVKSFRVEVAARATDSTIDIDLAAASALPTRLLHLRAEPPSGDGSPFGSGSRGSAAVVSADSDLLLGPMRKAGASADGRAFDIEIVSAQTDIAPERVLTRATLVAPDGSRSVRVEQGVVADAAVWTDFVLPPTVVAPDASRSLNDPLTLDRFPPGADLTIEIGAGGQLSWILVGPPGGPRDKSIRIPPDPGVFSSTDVQVLSVAISARLDRVALPPHGEIFRRASTSRPILVRKR